MCLIECNSLILLHNWPNLTMEQKVTKAHNSTTSHNGTKSHIQWNKKSQRDRASPDPGFGARGSQRGESRLTHLFVPIKSYKLPQTRGL